MDIDARRIGLIVFTIGVADILLMVWIPLAWKYIASPSSDLLSHPLLTATTNPLATWLQSIFVGTILSVRGAYIYTKRNSVPKGLLLSAISVIFTVSSMILFTAQNYNPSLLMFLSAVLLLAV